MQTTPMWTLRLGLLLWHCVVAHAQKLRNPCLGGSEFAKLPFCNATLPLHERVTDAIGRMSLSEKIGALNTNTPAIASLGLPAYNWWNEATSGVDTTDHESTKFPYPITTAMSFNRTLWHTVGRQIAMEARALMNIGLEYSTYWTPVINLAREPRWGRNIETPGEDPMLTGEYAEQFVRGFQEAPDDPTHLLASACCKHYVANEMEETLQPDGEHLDRRHVDTAVTMQDLVDSYMRPFQACVERGKVSSLMCSYNSVNGKPSCANGWLLTTVARETWDFDGYITSDCDADSDVYASHHYTETPEEAVKVVLQAGTDVDCGNFVSDNAASALKKGLISEEDIDERLQYLFRVRMRLGHFDPPTWKDSIPESIVCSNESISMSYDAMVQSATLLKNEKSTLPLKEQTAGLVAIMGPAANLSRADSWYYGPMRPCNGKTWSVQEVVASRGVKTECAAGVINVTTKDVSTVPEARSLAAKADTVIVAVGTSLDTAGEGHDATNISLTDAQAVLIEQVAAAAKNPIVVLVLTANPVDLSAVLSNPKVGAVLHLGQPSIAIYGIAEILFGDRAPAGRLVQTIYPSSYQDEISIFDFNMRPGPSTFARPDCTQNESSCPRGTNPGRTYRFYTGKPVLPFGYGLSYTKFDYKIIASPDHVPLQPLQRLVANAALKSVPFLKEKDLVSASGEIQWKEQAQYVVNVTNTGSMDADDVVLGFLVPPGAGKYGVPLKKLFGFERVHVKAGQTATVTLYPSMADFMHVLPDGSLTVLDGLYTVEFGVPESHPYGAGYAKSSSHLYAVSEIPTLVA